MSFSKIISIYNKFGLYTILSNTIYKIKNYFRKDKISLKKFILIVKSILLGLFLFGTGMIGIAIPYFLMRCYDEFKESFKFFCISCFIITFILVILYLYKKW